MEPFPASPEPEYQPQGPGPRPASVATAVKLIWLSVALSVVSAAASPMFTDHFVQVIRDNSPSLTENQARGTFYVTLMMTLILSVVLTALFAYFIGKGANWARIVYTVLSVFGLLGALGAVNNSRSISQQPAFFMILTLVSLVISVITVVLLFRPDSNAYFKKA